VAEKPNRSSLIASRIERLSVLTPQRLTFPRPLEAAFEAKTGPGRCKHLWMEGLLAILIFNLFFLVDHLAPSAVFQRALFVRLGIITPLALIVNFLVLRQPGKIFRESGIATIVAWSG